MSGGAPAASRQELVSFLAGCPAFAGVECARLESLQAPLEEAHITAGGQVPPDWASRSLVVRSGALLVYDDRGRTTDLLAPGDFRAPGSSERLVPIADATVVLLPDTSVDIAWSAPYQQLNANLLDEGLDQGRLQHAPVRSVMSKGLVTARPEERCQDVAARMRQHNLSSVIVIGAEGPGIVTDTDLRNRLVAEGRSPAGPVGEITTYPVRTLDARLPAFEALVEMLETGIHHMPVMDGGELVAMVTSSDLLQLRRRSPLYLRKAMDDATTVEELAAARQQLAGSVAALLNAGTTAANVGRIVATVTDRLTQRLIALAIDDLGEPPSEWAWIAFGSQGRREQTLHSDQDTGLCYPDGLSAEEERWFARMAARVTDGLARCGYPLCDGGVMASTPEWRRSASGWQDKFASWIRTPSSAHLLGAEIGFDLRQVAGDLDAEALLRPTIAEAAGQHVFLAQLAREAVSHRPPLGFWRNLTVSRTGEHAGTFDLKGGGMLPIADFARVHVLARGGREVGTDDRLSAAVADGRLSAELGSTLREGYELAMRVRLELHLALHARGKPLNNRVDPAAISPLLRSQLKETFKAVRTAQDSLEARYHTASIG